jgi:hypothetical protein
MELLIASNSIALLKSIIGKRILMVKRQVLRSDMDLENFEQLADGPIEIRLDNNKVICFEAITEINSVGVLNGEIRHYGESYIPIEVTNNLFWQNRINQEIIQIDILKSKYYSTENPSEFGIEFRLENGTQFCIEYLDEEDFPDTIRVIDYYQGAEYIRQAI